MVPINPVEYNAVFKPLLCPMFMYQRAISSVWHTRLPLLLLAFVSARAPLAGRNRKEADGQGTPGKVSDYLSKLLTISVGLLEKQQTTLFLVPHSSSERTEQSETNMLL